MTQTITIEHPEHGRVEGVTREWNIIVKRKVFFWLKSIPPLEEVPYFPWDGWREVPQAVDVMGECLVSEVGTLRVDGHTIFLPVKFSWHKLNAVVLPEDWWERWQQYDDVMSNRPLRADEPPPKNIEEWLAQFAQPVLTIRQEAP